MASSAADICSPAERSISISRFEAFGFILAAAVSRSSVVSPCAEDVYKRQQERLAKLAGGVAVIKVGAATEVEMKDKKLRIEDALSATKAAVEEGIVAGGGVAFINATGAVESLLASVDGDEKTGVNIVLKALEEPMRQICKNAGIEGSVVVDKVKESGKTNYGFDAANEKYTDLIEAGICLLYTSRCV